MDTDRDEPVISGNVCGRFGENLDKLGRGATLIALGTRDCMRDGSSEAGRNSRCSA